MPMSMMALLEKFYMFPWPGNPFSSDLRLKLTVLNTHLKSTPTFGIGTGLYLALLYPPNSPGRPERSEQCICTPRFHKKANRKHLRRNR
jgi:hypothetical protein